MKKLLVIFKTHLDIGFTDFSAKVVERYMNSFIPDALHTAKTLRESGHEARFVWTTGSWLIWEYLRTHKGADGEEIRKGIENGDIRWHGLPFTTHTELMSRELFEYGLSLSQEMDRQFGKKTIAAKMTDVPGHTKAIIPCLKKAGIEFLHIGVNPASMVPEVPTLFRWRNDSDDMINVMYQNDYGEFSKIGDSDIGVYFAHTGDNLGAQSPEDVIALFHSLREKMPDTEIVAADLNDLALAVRSIEDTLPVVTKEIGDTWIHGIGTDPKKVSQFRGLERFFVELPEGEDKDILGHGLIMVPEHTWGMDVKTHLSDHHHFKRFQFEQVRKREQKYLTLEASWQEQRAYLNDAVNKLSYENRKRALQIMGNSVRESAVTDMAQEMVPGEEISFHGYTLQFNRQGEIDFLEKDGKVIADFKHRLLTLCYEQFCDDDYKRFYEQYNRQDVDWSREDFQKIGMYTGVDCYRRYQPESAKIYVSESQIVVTYLFPEEAAMRFGCPPKCDMIIIADEKKLYLDLAWFQKPANRVAEAIWVGFHPVAEGKTVRKMGQRIDPKDVVKNGQCRLHGTDYGVVYKEMSIETLDTALVALQEPSLLNFCNIMPQDEDGVYFNLYNNVWGTNFPMWYDEDARFRFVLHFEENSL